MHGYGATTAPHQQSADDFHNTRNDSIIRTMDHLHPVEYATVIWALRATYLTLSMGLFIAYAAPMLRTLARYGKTLESNSGPPSTSYNVMIPKRRMRDYYIFATLYCGWMGYELIQRNALGQKRGMFLEFINTWVLPPKGTIGRDEPSLNRVDALLALGLMQFQVMRRLWDCVMVDRPSPKSKMPFLSHYVLGIIYYVLSCVAVWIEASPSLGIWNGISFFHPWVLLG